MKKIHFIIVALLCALTATAQEGETVFTYLLLPSSARASALGGNNVSVVENDISLVWQNPALLSTDMDMTVGVNYLAYIADVGVGNAIFARSIGETSVFGVGVNYSNYGNMLETTENQEILGKLNASDVCGSLFFSRQLTEMFTGGVAAKVVYSNYFHNTAIGLGVDLGICYFNPDNNLSIGLTGSNLGRQVKAYEEELADLPWDIQIGVSQRVSHAPIRWSASLVNLSHLRDPFLRHLVIGVELLPTDNFWIAAGYNARRSYSLSLTEGNKMGGFSLGAGLKVKAFSFGCAVGVYHPGATSFMLSVATNLTDFGL